jgi:hypothetical protein
MASSNFKLDGNTPTVTWADPKTSPDNSASSQVILFDESGMYVVEVIQHWLFPVLLNRSYSGAIA